MAALVEKFPNKCANSTISIQLLGFSFQISAIMFFCELLSIQNQDRAEQIYRNSMQRHWHRRVKFDSCFMLKTFNLLIYISCDIRNIQGMMHHCQAKLAELFQAMM
jgi:hypothetical protein